MRSASSDRLLGSVQCGCRTDQSAADSIRNQAGIQKQADAKVSDADQQLQGSTSADAESQRLGDYLNVLRANKGKQEQGLTPNIDGQNIRLAIPPLTEDRRKDLVKVVRKKAEEHKIAVRNIRHHAVDALKGLLKNHEITEDASKRASDGVQKLTDRYVKQIDDLVGNKEKEIMEV